jgi:hypothetical protein
MGGSCIENTALVWDVPLDAVHLRPDHDVQCRAIEIYLYGAGICAPFAIVVRGYLPSRTLDVQLDAILIHSMPSCASGLSPFAAEHCR